MKAYKLTKKNCGSYSHEIHVVLAKDKKELKTVAEKEHWNLKEFEISESKRKGIVHSDIY